MKFIEAIIMKYALVFSLVFIIYGLTYGVYISLIYWLSAVIAIFSLIADFSLYPKFKNSYVTIFDFFLSFIVTWVAALLLIGQPNFSLPIASFAVAVLLTIGEWFYHIYLAKRVFELKETSHSVKGPPKQS